MKLVAAGGGEQPTELHPAVRADGQAPIVSAEPSEFVSGPSGICAPGRSETTDFENDAMWICKDVFMAPLNLDDLVFAGDRVKAISAQNIHFVAGSGPARPAGRSFTRAVRRFSVGRLELAVREVDRIHGLMSPSCRQRRR